MKTLYATVTISEPKPGRYQARGTADARGLIGKDVTGHGTSAGQAIEDYEYRAAHAARLKHRAHCRIVADEQEVLA